MKYRDVICCMYKRVYLDYRAASFAAAHMGEKNFGPYQCCVCDGWHVGHHPKATQEYNRRSRKRRDAEQDEREAKFYASVERWKRGELADDIVRLQKPEAA